MDVEGAGLPEERPKRALLSAESQCQLAVETGELLCREGRSNFQVPNTCRPPKKPPQQHARAWGAQETAVSHLSAAPAHSDACLRVHYMVGSGTGPAQQTTRMCRTGTEGWREGSFGNRKRDTKECTNVASSTPAHAYQTTRARGTPPHQMHRSLARS